jgi:hypothetical protein
MWEAPLSHRWRQALPPTGEPMISGPSAPCRSGSFRALAKPDRGLPCLYLASPVFEEETKGEVCVQNAALTRLQKRAEATDPAVLVDTSDDTGTLVAQVTSSNHEIVHGRRGTGKTHLLHFVDGGATGRDATSASGCGRLTSV